MATTPAQAHALAEKIADRREHLAATYAVIPVMERDHLEDLYDRLSVIVQSFTASQRAEYAALRTA